MGEFVMPRAMIEVYAARAQMEGETEILLVCESALHYESKVADLESKLASERERLAALEAAARDFIAKVDRGEAQSKRSYAAFKAALALDAPTTTSGGKNA